MQETLSTDTQDFLDSLETTHFNKGSVVDEPEGGGEPGSAMPESFGLLGINGKYVYVYGGSVRFSGRASAELSEGTDPDDALNPNAVEVSGMSEVNPGCICLKMPYVDGPTGTTLVFITAKNPPDDDGSFAFKPLYAAYEADGSAHVVKDRRPDWCMGSPI